MAGSFDQYTNNEAAQQSLQDFASIIQLAGNIGFLIGIILFGLGIWKIRQRFELGPSQVPMVSSIYYMIAGTMLLSTQWWAATFYSTGEVNHQARSSLALDETVLNELDAVSAAAQTGFTLDGVYVVIGFLYMVGIISFIKGLYVVKDIGSNGEKGESAVWRAVNHIIGGLILMRLPEFSCLISPWLESVGFQSVCIS